MAKNISTNEDKLEFEKVKANIRQRVDTILKLKKEREIATRIIQLREAIAAGRLPVDTCGRILFNVSENVAPGGLVTYAVEDFAEILYLLDLEAKEKQQRGKPKPERPFRFISTSPFADILPSKSSVYIVHGKPPNEFHLPIEKLHTFLTCKEFNSEGDKDNPPCPQRDY